jgi:O-antigen/teichoic acid export membrane protein
VTEKADRPVAGRRQAAAATLVGSGASTFIAVAQAFVLIPLSLHYLGPRVYGAWLAAAELLMWVHLLDLGLANLLTQRAGAAFGVGDHRGVASWFTAGVLSLAGLAALVGTIAAILAPAMAVWAGLAGREADSLSGAFRLGIAAATVLLVSNAVVGLARALQTTIWVNLVSVLAALAGFAAAVALLVAGSGLWALAWGLVVRALVVSAGFAWFLIARLPRVVPSPWRIGRGELRETLVLAPSMAGANVGYLLMNHSEIPLVATFFGPQVATVYALTRKAAEALRGLLDSFGYAAYGGFAHLVTSAESRRSRSVLSELTFLRYAGACLAAGCYLAINEAFVALLFGRENFGGMALTAALAVLLVVGGQTFLLNYLYRAAGAVRAGSNLLLQESLLRLGAMVVGLFALGLAGAPAMAVLVSLVYGWVNRGRLIELLPASQTQDRDRRRWLLPGAVLAGGLVVGVIGIPATWLALAVTLGAIGLLGTFAIVAANATLRAVLLRGGWRSLGRGMAGGAQ